MQFILAYLAFCKRAASGLTNPLTRFLALGILATAPLTVPALILIFAVAAPELERASSPVAPSPRDPDVELRRKWRERLPEEDAALRARYEADPFLKSFLGSRVWIGRTTQEYLLSNGFWINAGYEFSGIGIKPDGYRVGSCSNLGAPDEWICGQGMGTPDWGISGEAKDRMIEAGR